jgi:hypothetical protein
MLVLSGVQVIAQFIRRLPELGFESQVACGSLIVAVHFAFFSCHKKPRSFSSLRYSGELGIRSWLAWCLFKMIADVLPISS